MHFIKELLEKPNEKDPVKTLPQVHKHFIRYSKGYFDAVALKIKISPKNISVDSSFEFEDLLLFLAANAITGNAPFEAVGTILGVKDITPELKDAGLNWDIKKSTGDAKNFKCTPSGSITKDQLLKLLDSLKASAYIMLTFKAGEADAVSIKTSKNPPRPSNKGQADVETDDAGLAKRVQFCKLKVPNTPKILELLINEALPDFKDEISSKTKSIELDCTYNIEELILPPKDKVKDSADIRQNTLRKGELIRRCKIDDHSLSKTVKFSI
jgi:hypothetical protein